MSRILEDVVMLRHHHKFALVCVLVACAAMTVFPSTGFADEIESAGEPTARQLELNDQGVRAIIQEDYERAVALLEESLVLGDWNITRLNLGRAYQKLGNCPKAKQALEAAKSAPPVADPPPKVVQAKAAHFLEELDETCSEQDYLAEPKQLAATPPTTSGRTTWGWISVAGGVALLAGGGAMHLAAEAERDEVRDAAVVGGVRQVDQADIADYEARANTYDTIGLSMAITGGVVAGIGTYLLLSSPADDDAPALSVGVLPGGGMVTWAAEF